ncbi:AMP-binding protein [Exilibacterium tricleocarpae]|uniref:AMP-binding protein n=1 Tax=Exilibacterium tricleocarpae TaxID=2591008 RepID=A0A545SXL1_9GAMM|nr:AMP-binding protein [Exilibacterium tricleocarpae]TQV69691.1 AMP-binding protein [Exilibacterium tricleocarpae]
MTSLRQLPLERLYHWEQHAGERIYLRQAAAGNWRDYTWGQVADQVRRVTAFLRHLAFAPGSRVAIYAKNCADWFIADFSIMMSGHISVPLYATQTADSMRYVLEHSDTQLVFVGAADSPENLRRALPDGVHTLAIQGAAIDCDFQLADILAQWQPIADNPQPPGDAIFTIMYTSGTTGNPKGVMHDYQTVAHAVPNIVESFNYTPADRFVSYLPLSHAAERIVVELQSLYCGASVAFPEGMDTFIDDLKRARPTFFFSVPRLWVKFKEAIETKLPPRLLSLLLSLPGCAGWIKRRVRRELGLEAARILGTGSAPTAEEVMHWYARLGMPLRDGYGMTENFAYGCMCEEDKQVPGAVGVPFDDAQVIIGADDEILFKSPVMMRGYYREPEETARVLRDGVYHTGDTGYIDADGQLHVTGRLSEVFKTTKGKFVKPTRLENFLGECALLGQVCVFGHGLDQPVLLAGIAEAGRSRPRPELEAQLRQVLAALNDRLETHEAVRQIFVVAEEWAVENLLLTPTLKLKRRQIEQRYRPWVEQHLHAEQTVIWEVPAVAGAGTAAA